MAYTLTLPARANLLGNPSDGNEGDFATISAAIELRAWARIQPAADLIFEHCDPLTGSPETYTPSNLPLPYTGCHDLLKGALNRLQAYSPQLRQKLGSHGFQICVGTDVPRQSGLGGSSLFVLLMLAGLRQLYDLDPYLHNDYVLSEMAQRVEALELGITCGYADRYAPLFGGLAYIDYRGKLEQRPMGEEPYATYERLDGRAGRLSLVAATTGLQRESGDVHRRMRPRYLEEYHNWQRSGGDEPPLVRLMRQVGETAWRGKIALLNDDRRAFGALMNRNHALVDEMMCQCGFADGAGWANNLFIQTALQNGALGAKLTGAGGGGSVFALASPGEEERIIRAWSEAAEKHRLTDCQIFPLQIATQGLTILTEA
jgi:galactokinase/mevalonate kinase-like predicted kinase